MTCEYTWPNHLLGSDREAVSALLEQHGLQGDVAFGHSKLFIRSPRTLVTLEQSRARLIPIIVLLLQKVRGGVLVGHPLWGGGWVSTESCRLCLAHSTLDGVPDILKPCVDPWLPSLSRLSLMVTFWGCPSVSGSRGDVHLLSPLSHTSFLPREPPGASLQGLVQMSCSFLRAHRALSRACLPSRATSLPKNKPPNGIGF